MDQEQEIQSARDKLAARFANATQIGGKGMLPWDLEEAIPLQKLPYLRAVCCRNPEKKEEACQRPECQ